MTSRSSHHYVAVRSGIKLIRARVLHRLAGSPALFIMNANIYKKLRRTVARFSAWQLRGLHS